MPESRSGLRSARNWKTNASISMPPPAIVQAISAPNGPVAAPNRPGSEKMPAPTIDPTTMAVKVKRENFSADDAVPFPDTVISAADAIYPLVPTKGARSRRCCVFSASLSCLLCFAVVSSLFRQ